MTWFERAEALDCFVLKRIYDPASKWECYVLAENPLNTDEIYCLLVAESIELCFWTYREIACCYNAFFEHPILDVDFTSVHVKHVINRLISRGIEWKQESALSD